VQCSTREDALALSCEDTQCALCTVAITLLSSLVGCCACCSMMCTHELYLLRFLYNSLIGADMALKQRSQQPLHRLTIIEILGKVRRLPVCESHHQRPLSVVQQPLLLQCVPPYYCSLVDLSV
jgi:hypothetical protein